MNESLINYNEKDKEVIKFDPVEVISFMFRNLLKREQEVLRRRFALNGRTRDTLEQIGKEYAITRERVRQIESSGLRKIRLILKEEGKNLNMDTLDDSISDILAENGGLMREDMLLSEILLSLSHTNNEVYRKNLLFLITYFLEQHERLLKEHESIHYEAFWYLNLVDIKNVKDSIEKIINLFSDHGQPMQMQELIRKMNENIFTEGGDANIDGEQIEKFINSQLHISKNLERNILDQWGLINWNTIVPKRMNDKIYLILKKEQRPLHFAEIAEKINEMAFDKKRAYPATVHNELILDNKYILVGRGVYALREWGYNDGTVSQVIYNILKEAQKPLDKKEIIEKVLGQRIVKKTTVSLALNDRSKFKLTEDGKYSLV